MKTDIQKYVAECDTCQRQKYEMLSPLGLLQPLHIPTQKWSEVSMDFITDLPTSEGKDSVFVVIQILKNMLISLVFHPKQKQSKSQIVM